MTDQTASWWEIRQPTVEECESTGASMDGVVILYRGEIVALQDEYETITIYYELREEARLSFETAMQNLIELSTWIEEDRET